MKIRYHVIGWLVAGFLLNSIASPARAQEPKPEAPAAQPPAAKASQTAPESKPVTEEEEPAPESSAVAAILAAKPSTPEECIRAAKNLVDLGYPQVAKRFVIAVLVAKLQPDQLADLGEQFGATTFIDLARQVRLLPEAQQLSDAVLAALTARRADPARIAKLIQQLQDPSEEKRLKALADLQAAGRAAVGALVAVLADPQRAAEHANVRTVLAGMGRLARELLQGVIFRADPSLAIEVILTLAEMNDPTMALCLLRPCFSEHANGSPEVRAAAAAALRQLMGSVPARTQAIKMLCDAADAYFHRRQPIEGVIDGGFELWSWDPQKRQCVARSGTPEDAARWLTLRWASDAYALAPDNREIRLQYTTAILDAAAYAAGLDQAIKDADPAIVAAKQLGVPGVDEVLAYAMAQDHPAAATAAARLLGEIGTAKEVLYQGPQLSPLAHAVQHRDRRLRMAALQAIVRLQPSQPFAGSSYVPAALGFFAASSGSRHALVAAPNIQNARDLAGLLAAAGFQTDTAASGKELLRLATSSPDYELAWIDVSIQQPEIDLVVQELWRDPRTALLRVGLTAGEGYLELGNRLARLNPMAKAFSRPYDGQAFRWQFEQLSMLAAREFVDFDQRQRQAAEALDMLAELSRSANNLYDLRSTQDSVFISLFNPNLALKAVAVLADLNSAESQRALLEVASRVTQPLELRKAAAAAFYSNKQKHGILLTTAEISEQYRRYNQSETQDAATQKVLGSILDCIEAGTRN